MKFGGESNVKFGGQTYTFFTDTKTYIAFSNLLILKITRGGGGGDFEGRRGENTEEVQKLSTSDGRYPSLTDAAPLGLWIYLSFILDLLRIKKNWQLRCES